MAPVLIFGGFVSSHHADEYLEAGVEPAEAYSGAIVAQVLVAAGLAATAALFRHGAAGHSLLLAGAATTTLALAFVLLPNLAAGNGRLAIVLASLTTLVFNVLVAGVVAVVVLLMIGKWITVYGARSCNGQAAGRDRDTAIGDDELVSLDLHNPDADHSMFRDMLARCAPDRPARDGDCLIVAPQVTVHLHAQAIEARTVTVIGWLDEAAGAVAFFHDVTIAGGYVLDATAQQFGPHLPERWVASVHDYLDRLAEATRVQSVTAHADRAARPPL